MKVPSAESVYVWLLVVVVSGWGSIVTAASLGLSGDFMTPIIIGGYILLLLYIILSLYIFSVYICETFDFISLLFLLALVPLLSGLFLITSGSNYVDTVGQINNLYVPLLLGISCIATVFFFAATILKRKTLSYKIKKLTLLGTSLFGWVFIFWSIVSFLSVNDSPCPTNPTPENCPIDTVPVVPQEYQ